MNPNILIQDRRVVQRHFLQPLQPSLELAQLGQPTSSLGLDLSLDVLDESLLEFNRLGENFFLQPSSPRTSPFSLNSTPLPPKKKNNSTHRALMISL